MANSSRSDEAVGPEKVQKPYPILLSGKVVHGFKRGSKQLGIPTANLPEEVAQSASSTLESGIYYGWARLDGDNEIHYMVMSYGWNPFYKNEKRTAEVHIINEMEDFYDQVLNVVIAGYIRPEKNYDNVDELIKDIHCDIEVAKKSLNRESYLKLKSLL